MCDASGQRVATLRLRGGSFELTAGAKRSSARGSRSGVLFEGEVCTEGLHVWPKERLDLIAGHAWVEPHSEILLSSAGKGALQAQALPELPELSGPFDCTLFWLRPGPPPPVEPSRYPAWLVLNAATVPVFDEEGRPLRTWIGEGRTIYQPTFLAERNGMRRLKHQLGPVVWDVWLRSEGIELATIPIENRMMDIGGISRREHEESFRPHVARREKPARVAKAAPILIGKTPDSATASGITLSPDVGVVLHEELGGFTAISFSDRAVTAPHGKTLWIETSAVAPP